MPSSQDSPRLHRALKLFIEFQSAESPRSQQEFLAEHEELRDLLEPMFLDESLAPAGVSRAPSPTGGEKAQPKRTLGDFDIYGEIGRGGMGVVYEARQRSVDRPVALKVLTSQLDTDSQAVARFHREASLAGRLNHPNIVDVFTVGSESDTYFFAMELVDGTPLDDVLRAVKERTGGDPARLLEIGADELRALAAECTESRSDSRVISSSSGTSVVGDARTDSVFRRGYVDSMVAITLRVTEALEHAHAMQVLHRDVKPSNVMLRSDGRVVLADFGLAREEGLPSMTVSGEFLGTPYYVSPEQATGAHAAVGATSDVFSVGAMLYELVTLSPPFRGATSAEVLYKVVNEEPRDPRRVHRGVPADLAAVILRCLEKDPDDRYADAGELAEDLRALLELRPVQARKISAGTRVTRWAQRNRALAMTGLIAASLLTIGSTVAAFVLSSQNEEIRAASRRANENAKSARDAKKLADGEAARARREATTAKRVTAFLVQLFEVADRSRHRGETITAREILDQGARRIALGLEDEPAVRATLMTTMGIVYQHLGLFDNASSLFEQSLKIRRESGAPRADIATSQFHLGELRHFQEDYAHAQSLYQESLKMLRSVYDGDHPLIARTIDLLGRARRDTGQFDAALKLHQEAMAMRRRLFGDKSTDLAESLQSLAMLRVFQGKPELALTRIQDALAMQRATAGPESTEIPALLHGLASIHLRLRNTGEARRYLEEAIAMSRKLFGEFHMSAAHCYSLLGHLEADAGKPDVAEKHLLEAIRVATAFEGEESRLIGTLTFNLGTIAVDKKEYERATRLVEQSLAIRRRLFGTSDNEVAISLCYLARLREAAGKPKSAAELLREAYTIRAPLLGNPYPTTQRIVEALIRILPSIDLAEEVGEWKKKLVSGR